MHGSVSMQASGTSAGAHQRSNLMGGNRY